MRSAGRKQFSWKWNRQGARRPLLKIYTAETKTVKRPLNPCFLAIRTTGITPDIEMTACAIMSVKEFGKTA